ncbi:hypothetical protein [Desulfovibrio sp. Fe33]|uniref:hypothetical protein n=1 Tax=Desulfovibrio sp. Fe33 TaxID=3020842 RepID=UPI00234D7C6A|nr:hypothetical protein [Desulfovibrio sp. Fe33]
MTLTLTGIRKDDKGGCLVKEEVTATIPDAGVQKTVREYIQYIDGTRLMEAPLSKGGSIPPLIRLDVDGAQWGIPVTLVNTGEQVSTDCNIVSVKKQKLFGKTRTVLTVKGKYCVPRKYASGIGLIEEADMRLTRIEHGAAQ